MKLRNRKTGKIVKLAVHQIAGKCYESLAEVNEDWEDYKEPVKPYWFINDLDGEPMKCDLKNCGKSNFIKWGEHRKQIGNYFESQEEAKQAVEKLKAWKRLKDKGFRFDGWKCTGSISFTFDNYCGDGQPMSASDYLDLLFGGNDESNQ